MSTVEDPSSAHCDRADAIDVLLRLREAGHVAYFAGGCVRDELLHLPPKDFDVATDAPPSRVRQLFPNTQAVGAAFGVILVRHHRSVVEVATFRTDLEYHDGRRPEGVRFTTAEDDAQRRDFTINGLFLDPVSGKVIDYVGGMQDLAGKVIRAIGHADARFSEDHLRLLRAVRFAARFNFAIEPATAAAIAAHAHQLPRISPERIADELRRMLIPPSRRAAWLMLEQHGLMLPVFRTLPREGDGAIDSSNGIFSRILPEQKISFGLALAAATLDLRWQTLLRPEALSPLLTPALVSDTVRAMRKGLKISNVEADELAGALNGAAAMLADPAPGVARQKRFLATPAAVAARTLLDAIAAAGLHRARIDTVRAHLAELEKTEFAPAPLVTGDDLTAAGAAPGRSFKHALDAVYDAQLEQKIHTKTEALEVAMRIILEMN